MGFYDFTVKDNNGQAVELSAYKGKALLVVNTATKCGLTPQYEALEALYKRFKGRGFELLDFPCNQFFEQAPGSDEEIQQFCTMTYGTTFPRFARINVNGEETAPLYRWLKEAAPVDQNDEAALAFEEKLKTFDVFRKDPADILWNFGKFLIDKDGRVAARFSPAFDLATVAEAIEKLL